MALDDLVKQVAASLEREGSPHAVFGDAVKLEHHTIVPVAVVSSGAGGGAASGPSSVKSASNHSPQTAGGGGFALMVRPVGFIHEEDGEVVFTPIHLDRGNRAVLNEAADAIRKVMSLATGFVSRIFKRSEIEAPNPSIEGIASPS